VKLESREMQRAIEKELQDGEEIVWCAQPRPEALGRHLHAFGRMSMMLYFLGVLSTFWTSALFLVVAIGVPIPLKSGVATRQDLWLLWVFPIMGLVLVWGGRWLAKTPERAGKAAAFTAYALTTSRLLIFDSNSKGESRKLRKFDAASIGRIVRIERRNDEGDLIFGEEPEEEFMMSGGGKGPLMRPIGLMGVDQPAEVERLIRETLLGGKRGSD
jgi:hypothetical protein